MKIHNECIPCAIDQIIRAGRFAGASEEKIAQMMQKGLVLASKVDEFKTSPFFSEPMYRLVEKETGVKDPYLEIKRKDMNTAKTLLPAMKEVIKDSKDRILTALKAAAIGNTLDSTFFTNPDLVGNISKELERPFNTEGYEEFLTDLKSAKTILLVGDNCGESYFDALLLKELTNPSRKLYYAVRHQSIINDITREMAIESGIEEFATIIDSGSTAPGTDIDIAPKEFLDVFNSADIIISKGQGNYETLTEQSKKVYYLLRIKCPVISRATGQEMGTYVFKIF